MFVLGDPSYHLLVHKILKKLMQKIEHKFHDWIDNATEQIVTEAFEYFRVCRNKNVCKLHT